MLLLRSRERPGNGLYVLTLARKAFRYVSVSGSLASFCSEIQFHHNKELASQGRTVMATKAGGRTDCHGDQKGTYPPRFQRTWCAQDPEAKMHSIGQAPASRW